VDIAYKNSERLVRLINDILDIEKIESGKMVFDIRPVEVEALLQRAMDDNEGFAQKYNVTLINKDEAAGGRVMGDFDRLLQVITNLVSNAVKFSPFGGQVLLSAQRQGSSIKISITDHGPGISEKFQS